MLKSPSKICGSTDYYQEIIKVNVSVTATGICSLSQIDLDMLYHGLLEKNSLGVVFKLVNRIV